MVSTHLLLDLRYEFCVNRQNHLKGYIYFGNTSTELFHENRKPYPTNTGRQRVVPCPSLPCHALEKATSVESVAWIAPVNDSATRKVALVADLVSKLWNARILTM